MKAPVVLTLLAALLAAYLVAPFLAGAGELGRADWRGADIAGIAGAGLVSVVSASLATMLVAAGGVPLGFLLARRRGRGLAWLGFVLQLPLALPPLASGVLLLFLLGYSSPLGRLAGGALTDSFAGIVLAETFVAAPFLIVAARSAFAGVDPALEDVAATLGHRPGAVFWRVSLASASRGIAAGMLLTWLRAFGEFGATVMVAYHPYSLPVYTYIAFGGEGLPAMAPILLPTVAVAMLVMGLSLRAEGGSRSRRPRPTSRAESASRPPPHVAGPSQAAPAQPLSFRYAWRRDGFNLDVAWKSDARRLAILGASGSGKSATLRLIAGLDRADRAALTLGSRDLAAAPPFARAIAYVPQSYGLMPHLRVDQQIRFGVDCDPARARLWTERLGLGGLEHRRPAELSLGQQQRVALARALSRESRLLLLDEPFSALDAPLRARLRAEFSALQSEIDATTLLVTHDPAEAMLLADELLLLDNGSVLQSGAVDDVFSRPVNEAAARLLGAENVSTGVAVAPHSIDIGGALLEVSGKPLTAGPVGWAVRPQAIRVVGQSGYPGEITQVDRPRAGQRGIVVRVGRAVLRAFADTASEMAPGPCRLQIDPGGIQAWSVSDNNTN